MTSVFGALLGAQRFFAYSPSCFMGGAGASPAQQARIELLVALCVPVAVVGANCALWSLRYDAHYEAHVVF
jgi:hypothetical protein